MSELYIIATDPHQDLNARYEAVRMMKQMRLEEASYDPTNF